MLPDTLAATASTAPSAALACCPTNGRSPNFYPIAYLLTGVRLTAYSGGATDLPAPVVQRYLNRTADKPRTIPHHRQDRIREAHHAKDTNTITAKLVVLTGPKS